MSSPLLERTTIKVLILFALVMVVFAAVTFPLREVSAQNTQDSQYYYRDFTWNYGGHTWNWNLSIPINLYNEYVSVNDFTRTQIPLSKFGYFTTTDDAYVQALAEGLNQTAQCEGYSGYDEVNFILSFVQSIPYATDNQSTGYQDYPRFPVETLVDDIGDCKSHSVLFATLSLILDYGAVYINPPDHLAVGILGDNLSGTYWSYQNQNYYYCETTGSGFTIGQLPDQFNGVTAYVYGIDTSLQYEVNSQLPSSSQPAPTIAPNINSTPAPSAINQGQNGATPVVAGPTAVPVAPISLSKDPWFFALIILAVGAAIAATLLSTKTRHPKTTAEEMSAPVSAQTATLSSEPDVNVEGTQQPPSETQSEQGKYCIYCGAANKSYAVYCESCGKKIG
jgi:hypothetical protein